MDPQPRPAGDRAHQPGAVPQASHERDDDQRREQQRNPPGAAAAAQAAPDHPALPRDEQQDHQPGDAVGDGRPPPAVPPPRPLGDPIATVATPVPKTSTRATRSFWLVILPAGDRKILRNPATLPP